VTRYIANSAATKRNLISIGVRSRRITVIYPPLDLSMFDLKQHSSLTRSAFGVPASSPCFGIVGLLVPWKGQDVFLRAAKRVLEKVPEAYALVVGGAPSGGRDYAESLRHLAAELGIDDRVVFTGYRADVPDVLRLLDVVAHASVQPEPFGRVIAEAMAMGRPVVASNARGPTEIIEDARTAFVLPDDDEACRPELPPYRIRFGQASVRRGGAPWSRGSRRRVTPNSQGCLQQSLGPRRWSGVRRTFLHVRPTDRWRLEAA
jgi:glycosyltransferase involved in cell wall biosynthesis